MPVLLREYSTLQSKSHRVSFELVIGMVTQHVVREAHLVLRSRPMMIRLIPPPSSGFVHLLKSSYICSSVVKKLKLPIYHTKFSEGSETVRGVTNHIEGRRLSEKLILLVPVHPCLRILVVRRLVQRLDNMSHFGAKAGGQEPG